VMAGISQKDALLQVVIANYQISKSLMGPIPGGNEEELTVPGIGKLADMTYPERRTFSYADKDGYDLTIGAIPDSWGDLTVKQYRIDASNNFALIATTMSKPADRAQAGLKVSGKWARAAKSTNDPTGAAQGVDFIAVTGSAASTPAE
jgi:hypothetical protein